MSILNKIGQFISGSGANLINVLTDSVDRFVTTPEEKEKLKQELLKLQIGQQQNEREFIATMETLTQQREKEIEETIRKELEVKQNILMAELNQDDKFTKRARPTVVYVGLAFILLELLGLRHIIMHHIGIDKEMVENSDQVLKMFLGVWGGVLGVYSIGRSVEKRGTRNSWTSLITGNKDKVSSNKPIDLDTSGSPGKIKW
jgi:hypothetical protein